MMLDDYVAWAAGIGAIPGPGEPGDRALHEAGLGLASEIGEVAAVLLAWLGDDERCRDRLADELGDVAYYWARLCAVTGVAPSTLLARSRAHVEWRRAGRPAGGPAANVGEMTLEEFAAWVVGADGAGPEARPDDRSLGDIGLALVGDAGEVAECLRRLARGGEREHLAGELGDVWRYWTRLCVASGVSPADLLARSRAKIEGRIAAAGRTKGTRLAGGAGPRSGG
jgi:NTP pyrophosphatase (non-canonical NTP hydrolase)